MRRRQVVAGNLIFAGKNVDDYEFSYMVRLDLRPNVAVINGFAAASDFFGGCLRNHGNTPPSGILNQYISGDRARPYATCHDARRGGHGTIRDDPCQLVWQVNEILHPEHFPSKFLIRDR